MVTGSMVKILLLCKSQKPANLQYNNMDNQLDSGDDFSHLQEHQTVCYSLWYNATTILPAGRLEAEFLCFQATGRQHRGCIIP